MKSLAERLRFARTTQKLTQDQLATKAGVKQSDISKLERGDMAKTTALPALARALQCDVDWLDTGHGQPDFGRPRRGWPFGEIDPSRFAALDVNQRMQIQGAVLAMILSFEGAKPGDEGGRAAKKSSSSKGDHWGAAA